MNNHSGGNVLEKFEKRDAILQGGMELISEHAFTSTDVHDRRYGWCWTELSTLFENKDGSVNIYF
jgi:hypothetical protein